jgi:hypothetical protein
MPAPPDRFRRTPALPRLQGARRGGIVIVEADPARLAEAARLEAEQHPHRSPERRAAAHLYTALTDTSSVGAAKRAITTFGDEQTQRDAIELLYRLAAGQTTAKGTTDQ